MPKSKILYLIVIVSLVFFLFSGCGSSTDTVETETEQKQEQEQEQEEQEALDIPHVLEGRDDCLGCHNTSTNSPVPSDHQGRANDGCTDCHKLASNPSTNMASSIPHELEGRANCLMCHAEGTDSGVPASHVGRTNAVCTACHQPG